MIIGGLQKLTLIDYPGKVSCTVFTIGCNFRCPFCYSSELVLPEKIRRQPKTSEREFFQFLQERKNFLEGVVVCGGEPTIHKDLPDFIKKIKELGYSVKLDTNGSNPQMLKALIEKRLIDYAAMDIKAPLGKSQIPDYKSQTNLKSKAQNSKLELSRYQKAAGVKADLKKIKKSIEIIKNSGIDYEFRTTVVPGLHPKEDIIEIAKELSPARKYFLQNFLPEKTLDPKFEKIKPFSEKYLLEIQKTVAPFFEICQTR